ncbi:hypothetical protein ACHAXT_011248 [Thalassiosira profunda]
MLIKRDSRKYGWAGLLKGTDAVPTKREYDAAVAVAKADRDATQNNTVLLWEANSAAYSDLLLSMDVGSSVGKVAFFLVESATTDDNPDGSVKVAWDALQHKYWPHAAATYAKLDADWNAVRLLSAKTDPATLLIQLEMLMKKQNYVADGVQGKSKKTETDVVMRLATPGVLPAEYHQLQKDLLRDLQRGDQPLTLDGVDGVRERLNNEWLIVKSTLASSAGGEHALHAADSDRRLDALESEFALFAGRFKGLCNKCGKQGHKGADCKSKSDAPQPAGTGRFRSACWKCGKLGHKKRDCPSLREKGNVAMECDGEPCVYAGHEDAVELGFVSIDESIDEEGGQVLADTDVVCCDPSQQTRDSGLAGAETMTVERMGSAVSTEAVHGSSGASLEDMELQNSPFFDSWKSIDSSVLGVEESEPVSENFVSTTHAKHVAFSPVVQVRTYDSKRSIEDMVTGIDAMSDDVSLEHQDWDYGPDAPPRKWRKLSEPPGAGGMIPRFSIGSPGPKPMDEIALLSFTGSLRGRMRSKKGRLLGRMKRGKKNKISPGPLQFKCDPEWEGPLRHEMAELTLAGTFEPTIEGPVHLLAEQPKVGEYFGECMYFELGGPEDEGPMHTE